MTQSVTESSQAWILIRGIRIQMRDISMEDIFCPSEAPMTLENSPNQLAPSIFSMQRPRTSQDSSTEWKLTGSNILSISG